VSIRYLHDMVTGRTLDLEDDADLAEFAASRGQAGRTRSRYLCDRDRVPVYAHRRPTAGARDLRTTWAGHLDESECTAPKTSRSISDEHLRMQEFHVRAAETVGIEAATEVRISKARRADVVLTAGDRRTSFEVQRSASSRPAAVERQRTSLAAGMAATTWCLEGLTDLEGHVPFMRFDDHRWQESMPPYGRLTITGGVRRITAKRCRAFVRCPITRSGDCGRYHPDSEPRLGVVAEDAIVQVATGLLVAVKIPGMKRSSMYVDTTSSAVLAEMVGFNAEDGRGTSNPDRPDLLTPPERAPCTRPAAPLTDLRWFQPPRGPVATDDLCWACGRYCAWTSDGFCWHCAP